MYKRKDNYSTPLKILIPVYKKYNGVISKTYEEGFVIFASFKTFGGTDKVVNGIYSIEDTAYVETWYNPEIKSDCQVERLSDGAKFEILGEPENIEESFKILKFKVRRMKGNG